MRVHSLALAVAGMALAGTAVGAPYAPFDVRAAGMGGTGVASAKSASAALFNPAMLSAQAEGDKFQFVLGAGATVADEDKMLDQVDALQASIDNANTLITTWFPASGVPNININIGVAYPSSSTEYQVLTGISSATSTLVNQFNAVDNDSLIAGLGAGLGFGVPGKTFGVGVFATSSANVVATPQIDPADTLLLSQYAGALADGAISSTELAQYNAVFSELTPGTVSIQDVDNANPLQSTVNGLAVALAEYGVGFSHNFELASGGQLSLGITPKVVNVITYDYTANVDSFDDADIDTQEKSEETFDLDLGAVFKPAADSSWQYALVAKHVIGGDFVTSPNLSPSINPALPITQPKNISLSPQIRVGAARMTKRTTLALDLDLVENDGISAGGESQFLAFGAEYDLSFLQLRAGYRANLADSDVSDVATLGLGLGPVDISAVASDTTVGAYLQLGFGW